MKKHLIFKPTFLSTVAFLSFFCLAHGHSLARKNNIEPKEIRELKSNPLMVILLDGYRWDYFESQKSLLPGFSKFLENGVRAKWVNPLVSSVSFPNWHTLSTGLYAENHGIIGNDILNVSKLVDPNGSFNEAIFSLSNLETTKRAEWWKSAEPIWTTAMKSGKKSFCFLWSRCDVPFPSPNESENEINGDGEIPSEDSTGYSPVTIEKGLEAMALGLERGLKKISTGTDLAMIYVEYSDAVGHKFGADSAEMKRAIVKMDAVFSQFLQKLETKYKNLQDKLNVIVVSDHGMTNIGHKSRTKYIALEHFVDLRDVAGFVPSRNFVGVLPAPGKAGKLYQSLKGIPEGVDVYSVDQIPEHWHFKHSPLVLPFLVVAKPGFAIVSAKEMVPEEQGQHGWNPREMKNMRSIFYASGPAFKKNVVVPPMEIVDIYQIYTHVLKISPQPNNGTWDSVKDIFA